MNIVEKMKEILMEFPKISAICSDIHIDFTDPDPTSYGLSSTGDSLVSEDVLGGQTRRHTFLFYASYSGINDFERTENSTALTELCAWLTQQTGGEVTTDLAGEEYTGEIIGITAGNGRLYAIEDNNIITGMRYQLQIEAQYTAEF